MTSISFFGLNLFCILQLLVSTNSTHFHPPDHFNVAGNSPILKAEGEISDVGIAVQHAIILALRELNDKNDGIADDILPETVLQIALRSQLPYFKNGVETAERQVDAFDGEKLMGSIGPSDFEVLYGASRVFRDNHVAVIGYNDRHAALGLSDIFSNTLRTIPGYYIDGRILADVVESFHWEHVAVFSTSDTYGNMAKFFFEQEAKSKHLHILSDIHISPNTENFDEYLDQVKRDGAKIFVFLMHASVTAKLIKRGYERNIFNDHTQLLGAEHASDMDEWALVEPTLSSIMTGYMGVKYHSFPEDSEGKMRFIERFRNQESTLGDGVNCNNATDDTGYFLYMIDHDNDAGTPDVCTGLNFSVFHEDGSNIPSAAFYAYDATYALAYALHSLSYVHEVEFIDSESVKNELLQYVEFDGATGHIGFSTTFLDDGFDVGGRDEGLTFDLLNYDHKFETEEFKVVGAYHIGSGLEYCDGCSVVFPGHSSTKPLDHPEPHSEHISVAMLSVIVIISCISILLVILCLAMHYIYRSTRLIKASQPVVGYIILGGCILGSFRALTAVAEPDTGLCLTQLWAGHLAFAVVFSALLVKTWKVHRVMNQTMKRVKVTTKTTIRIIVAATVPVLLYLLFISTLGYVRKGSVLVFEDQHEIIYEDHCSIELHDAMVGLYVVELLAMLYGLYLCYLIRNIPDGISNSKAIADTILVIFGLSVGCITLLNTADFDPNVNKSVVAITFSLCTIVTVDNLYRTMFINLLMGRDMTKAFVIEKGQHRSIFDVMRGVSPAKVISPENPKKAIDHMNSLKYDPKDSASMVHRKKMIHEEMAALQAELAELMEREMYAPTNSRTNSSSAVDQLTDQGATKSCYLATNTAEKNAVVGFDKDTA